ncbi:MAG: DNA polymerase subunit beta [Thermoleophilia bacterium]
MNRPVSPPRAIESFAVETRDGLIFTVKGLLHPADRVIAYLRYVPDPTGERLRNKTRYRRVYYAADQVRVLAESHPAYIRFDRALGARVQTVPWEDITRVYDPRRRLSQISSEGGGSHLEELALELATTLARAGESELGVLGVTGSLLFRLTSEDSDVDLVVYGGPASERIHSAARRLMTEQACGLRPLTPREVEALHQGHRTETPIDLDKFALLQGRKVNEGRFKDRSYFLRFVRLPGEIGEAYGDPSYRSGPRVSLQAEIVGDGEAIFTPNRYSIERVEFGSGGRLGRARGSTETSGAQGFEGGKAGCEPEDARPLEIISFRGRFAEQAKRGERVRARGRLERVIPRAGRPWWRLNVGGEPGDYLIPV